MLFILAAPGCNTVNCKHTRCLLQSSSLSRVSKAVKVRIERGHWTRDRSKSTYACSRNETVTLQTITNSYLTQISRNSSNSTKVSIVNINYLFHYSFLLILFFHTLTHSCHCLTKLSSKFTVFHDTHHKSTRQIRL